MALIISPHCLWALCNSGSVQMKTCHVRSPPAPTMITDLSIVCGLLPKKFCAGRSATLGDLKHSSSPTAGRAGKVIQSGIRFLEYPNEIKLKWGTIIVRTCTAATRSLFGFASVFFFSWIEYQLISWVICCSGNWVKGWEQTAHIQASHQGREDNKIVQFYSCFSLLCVIIELVAVQLMCINSTKIGKPLYIWHKSVATCKFTEIQTVERNNSWCL